MEQKNTVTRMVQILDILPGDPPSILTGERLLRNGKPGRLFQQMVPVPDADLFSRLIAQAGTGDTIDVTVTTEWRADGYRTYLSDFTLPAPVLPTEPQEAQIIK